MADLKEVVLSDTEGQEKPVREQLKKASISQSSGKTSVPEKSGAEGIDEQIEAVKKHDEQNGDDTRPGRGLKKKRSFDEIEGEQAEGDSSTHTRTHHSRKRSRDSTTEEDQLNNGRRVSDERKRDDMETEAHIGTNGHSKTSTAERPGTPEATREKKADEQVEAIASPKTKRSRLHSSTAEDKETPTAETATATTESTDTAVASGGHAIDNATPTEANPPEETVASTEAKSPTPIPPGSGFANTSSASPFASVSKSKSPPPETVQTYASAFAASGFGSLSAAATSGFGTLGQTSSGFGGFGGKSADSKDTSDSTAKAPSTSAFGGALGQQSAFGGGGSGTFGGSSNGSGFGGKLGGGSVFGGGSAFGGLSGVGAGLSTFGSGKTGAFSSSSSKPPKPFGAPADDEDEQDAEEDDESGFKSPLSQDSDKRDERFYAQDRETGEEDEITEYSCRAKLYNFAVVDPEKGKKEWKERGLGTVKLNIQNPAPGEEDVTKPKARLLMRADGSHRLVLNTPVKKEIHFGAPGGGAPTGGYLYFMGTVDGKAGLELLQLKVRCSCLPFYLRRSG